MDYSYNIHLYLFLHILPLSSHDKYHQQDISGFWQTTCLCYIVVKWQLLQERVNRSLKLDIYHILAWSSLVV